MIHNYSKGHEQTILDNLRKIINEYPLQLFVLGFGMNCNSGQRSIFPTVKVERSASLTAITGELRYNFGDDSSTIYLGLRGYEEKIQDKEYYFPEFLHALNSPTLVSRPITL